MSRKLKNFNHASDEEFRKEFRDIRDGQSEHDLYNRLFGNEVGFSGSITLQNTIKSWLTIVNWGGPIPNSVFDYTSEELLGLSHTAF